MLTYDPSERISSRRALKHEYFEDLPERMALYARQG